MKEKENGKAIEKPIIIQISVPNCQKYRVEEEFRRNLRPTPEQETSDKPQLLLKKPGWGVKQVIIEPIDSSCGILYKYYKFS